MKNLFFFFFVLLSLSFFAQDTVAQKETRTISGIIKSYEEATPLEGVLVTVKGTQRQSGSQPDGIYYITVSAKDSVLKFSYDGFYSQEIKITNASEYNISLKRSDTEINKRGESYFSGLRMIQRNAVKSTPVSTNFF